MPEKKRTKERRKSRRRKRRTPHTKSDKRGRWKRTKKKDTNNPPNMCHVWCQNKSHSGWWRLQNPREKEKYDLKLKRTMAEDYNTAVSR